MIKVPAIVGIVTFISIQIQVIIISRKKVTQNERMEENQLL